MLRMHDAVVFGAADGEAGGQRRGVFVVARGDAVGDRFHRRLRQRQRGIGRAQLGSDTEQGRNVAAPAFELTIVLEEQQRAVWLDRTGNMDRLVSTG